jgi:hypothetical protein
VPDGACVVRFRSTGRPALDAGGGAVEPFAAESGTCDDDRAPAAVDEAVLVLPAGPPSWPDGSPLAAGDAVELRWRVHPAWPGVLDAVGSNVPVVRGGAPAPDIGGDAPIFRDRAPRTAVGWRADGRLLLVTVDGRQPGSALGMSLPELADLLVALGAVEAANLDGGGSTTMAVGDALANRPSDVGGQRAVGPVLVVLGPGAEAAAAAAAPPEPVPAGALTDPAEDPASVGGLAAVAGAATTG